MRTEFEIKISTFDMYRFLMYHTYHGTSGIFSVAAGLALIVFYFVKKGQVVNSWIYLAFGILFLVYLPWTLYTRAAQQVRLGTMFKKPLKYILSPEGVTVWQETSTAEVGWQNVCRVRETGKSILVYTGKKNAFIWVKSQLKEQEMPVRQILQEYVPASRLALKRV